jgi:formate dehydrogenase iron-sulfur subunit
MSAVSDRAGLDGWDEPDGHASWGEHKQERVGFFTDTTVCIGCKACEVACKEWNLVPEDGLDFTGYSYDNTKELSADTWRHVAFIEQKVPLGAPQDVDGPRDDALRWLMSSDVCKHCTHAGCLDVCPTGAIFRTEFGTVVIQDDVCNGCGYCVVGCPFGVIGKREIAGVQGEGGMHKCTLCYDRLEDGMTPACAKACPTESIQFGPLDELLRKADERVQKLQGAGVGDARLYGATPDDGVGGMGAFFLLLDEPEVYGLPPEPVVPTKHIGGIWAAALVAAAALAGGILASFAGE